MGVPHEMRPDMSVTDLAFYILKNRGKSLHFKELISEIMRVKAISQENPGRLIAQMHTEINLDSRFLHQGSGEWGLREWLPKSAKVLKIRPETPAPPARRPVLRAEEDDEDSDDDDYDRDEMEEEISADEAEADESYENEEDYYADED